LIGLSIILRTVMGTVRRVGRNVGKERFVFVGLNEFNTLFKPNVGAVSVKPLVLAVDDISIVEVIVSPIIGSLPNAASPVVYAVLEASILRPVRVAVP
jgi:hypothetical protein